MDSYYARSYHAHYLPVAFLYRATLRVTIVGLITEMPNVSNKVVSLIATCRVFLVFSLIHPLDEI